MRSVPNVIDKRTEGEEEVPTAVECRKLLLKAMHLPTSYSYFLSNPSLSINMTHARHKHYSSSLTSTCTQHFACTGLQKIQKNQF